MKGLKMYLTVVTVLLVLALLAGVYVWYTVQKLQREGQTGTEFTSPTPSVRLDKS